MKKQFLLILFILTVSLVSAQTNTLDSLKRKLKNEFSDSVKVELILDIGYQYLFANIDSALWYFENALALAREQRLQNTEIRVKSQIARALTNIGNYPEALRLSLDNVQITETIGDSVNLWFSKRQIMWIYREMGDAIMELKYGRELVQLADKFLHDPKYNSYDEMSLRYMGTYYLRNNMLDSAFHYYSQSINLAKKLPNPRQYLLFNTKALGDYYLKKEQYDSALFYYDWSNSIAPDFSRNDVSIINLLNIADIYIVIGEPAKALMNARDALTEARVIPDTLNMVNAANKLALAFEQMMKFDSAYFYLKFSTELLNRMALQAKINSANNLMFNETLYKQQVANEIKQADARLKNNLRIYGLLASAFVLIIITLLLYRNNLQKMKDAAAIQASYNQLKTTQAQLIQSEKMASLGELTAGIAHEIQNPLNFVNNFSDLNKELIDELKEELAVGNRQLAEEIANDIKENEQKINHHGKRADAIVKGMLQHSRTSSGVKVPTDINALADEYLRLAYHGLRAKDKSFNADFVTDFDESLPKINVIPQDIGRVLLNLINNAFYAVDKRAKSNDPLTPKGELKNDQTKYQPTVTVITTSSKSPSELVPNNREDLGVRVVVKDNGGGIPSSIVDKIFQPFFTTKPTGQGTGLGLSLAYDIVKAHGGELKVKTKEGEGTEFIVQLPNNT